MENIKLASFEEDKNGATYSFENTDIMSLANEIGLLFTEDGYKLEEGTPENGVYGKGSAFLRILFGAFAKRYKFKIAITPESEKVILRLDRRMTGASGGLIGHSKMKTEFARIVERMKTLSS